MARSYTAAEGGASFSKLIKNVSERLVAGNHQFEDGINETGIQASAYLRLLESGKLPPPRFANGERVSSDRKSAMEISDFFKSIVSKKDLNKEHSMTLDADGRIVTFTSGDKYSVGSGYATDLDPYVKSNGYWQSAHKISAGGTSIHNHPHGDGDKGLEQVKVGNPPSGSDILQIRSVLGANSIVLSNSGTYIIKNKNWKKDKESILEKVAFFEKKANNEGKSKKEIEEVKKSSYNQAVGELVTNSKFIKEGVDMIMYKLYEELSDRVHPVPESRTVEQCIIINRAYFQATKKFLKNYGISIDFVPNKGFEEINKPL